MSERRDDSESWAAGTVGKTVERTRARLVCGDSGGGDAIKTEFGKEDV